MSTDNEQITKLLQELTDPDWNIRLSAAVELGRIRRSSDRVPEVVQALIAALKDENEFIPRDAAMALGNLGPGASASVPALRELLKADDEMLRQSVIYSLGKIGTDSACAVPDLVAGLDDPSSRVRGAVPWALSMVARENLEMLVVVLKDTREHFRVGAAQALGKVGAMAASTADALMNALSDSSHDVRFAAAKALGNIRDVPQAVPLLIDLLKDSDVDVRWAASEALRKIGTDEAMTAWAEYEPRASVGDLIKQLKHPNRLTRENAAKSLRELGKNAKEALTALTVALKDQLSPKVRAFAAEALGRMGPEAEPAVEELCERLRVDEDLTVKRGASQALGRIGQEAYRAVPLLAPFVKLPDREVAQAAAMALQRIGTPDALDAIKGFKWE